MATSNLMLLHVPRNGTAKTTIYRIIQYVKKSRKSGGWQSRYCVWLQSGTRRGGVPLHEAEIDKDHWQAAGKGRCDRLPSAAILPARRDHARKSQSTRLGAGRRFTKRIYYSQLCRNKPS